jgi:hypothetical protein
VLLTGVAMSVAVAAAVEAAALAGAVVVVSAAAVVVAAMQGQCVGEHSHSKARHVRSRPPKMYQYILCPK